MKRFVNQLAVIILAFGVKALLSDACGDVLLICEHYKEFCNYLNVQQYCRKTCSLCNPVQRQRINNQCLVNNGGCEHLCNWTDNKLVCSCFEGFKLDLNRKTCSDIDECKEGPNPCVVGMQVYCVNTIGSYSCQVYKCRGPRKMNYYRSGSCCAVKNSTCGLTATIRNGLQSNSSGIFFSSRQTQRIFGGAQAVTSAWPWMAQILYHGISHCGATLITNKWMLSAAHCFRKFYHDYQSMTVYLGQVRSAHITYVDTTRRIERKIQSIIIHQNYAGHDNDIALVELNEPVIINDIISPICLPCGEIPNVGDKCWATGFGKTETSGEDTADVLREVDVPIVSLASCRKVYEKNHTINSVTMFCAGYEVGGKDTCKGDSGGPLACQRRDSCEWYLSGITSFGKGCAEAIYYGVYVNVTNYETWINQSLGKDAFDICPKMYDSPCAGFFDVEKDCEANIRRCNEFPLYMEANCKLSCCRHANKGDVCEISNCYDTPRSARVCEVYAQECNNPLYRNFMQRNCKMTCNFC